jgi:hypothetical protein
MQRQQAAQLDLYTFNFIWQPASESFYVRRLVTCTDLLAFSFVPRDTMANRSCELLPLPLLFLVLLLRMVT